MIKGYWISKDVYVEGKELLPLDSQGVTSSGFNWGYGGSGPAQLALALLLKFSNAEFAQRHYEQFKWDLIAILPQDDFEFQEEIITDWIKKYCDGKEIIENEADKSNS